jgi:OmpA-OmpF porin, OOP family
MIAECSVLTNLKKFAMKYLVCFLVLIATMLSQLNAQSLVAYSKFDFVPGEKILVYEDFTQDAIGDFPARWNTNASGEVVTVEGHPGHWLMISKKGRFIPEFITSLPENFTFQFDLLCNENFSYYSNPLQLSMLTVPNAVQAISYDYVSETKWSAAKIGLFPTNPGMTGGAADVQTFEEGVEKIKNEVSTSQFNSNGGRAFVKVSVWRQKQRLRVYLNEEKLFDIPHAFAEGKTYRTIMFELWGDMFNAEDRFLISNLRLAVGAADTRYKLMTEGKFVTRGILFDVNSDRVKPESYGVLKDIATVLKENLSMKVMIVGHTDADGNDAENLTLSKSRAESVRKVLMNEFKIEGTRLLVDGKGESQPVDNNNTAEGKANNRRVEFIRQPG